MLGLKRGTVQLAPYAPSWRHLYEVELARLREALGARIGCAEHVGSTAIDGMVAKPIIDIVIAVPGIEAGRALIPELEALGYEFRPDDSTFERVFLACGPRERRTHHLSLTPYESQFWVEKLVFRNYLRAHSEKAREYAELKKRLASAFADNRRAYTDGKLSFVYEILSLAKGDAGQSCQHGQ